MRTTMSVIINGTKSTLKSAYKTAKKILTGYNLISRRTLIIAPTAFIITVLFISSISFNMSYALAVSYKGETVGYVTSKEVYNTAIDSISESIDGKAKECLEAVSIKEEVTAGGKMLDAEDLETAIITNADDIAELYGLYKNGELYAVSFSETEINAALQEYLKDNSSGVENAEFTDSFEIVGGYFSAADAKVKSEIYSRLKTDEIKVLGYEYVTETEKVKYITETSKSEEYAKGETVVVRKGKNGKREVTSKVYYENGVEIKRETVSQKVIKNAVSRKVIKGTGDSFHLDFPLSKSSGYNITSYYGEYRGGYSHQGMDIVTGFGTPIYASAGGTVVEAEYSPYGWGLNVLIDHGNGIKTRYAHCSALSVSAGDKVSRGEKIAEVGSTGDASCNHVHFEAYRNGVRVNPENYFN